MIKINNNFKSIDDLKTKIPSGIQMNFDNGNTISIQFGFGNYGSNRGKSDSQTLTAEVAIWDDGDNWHQFEGDTVEGWCNADEVAKWIHFAANNKIKAKYI